MDPVALAEARTALRGRILVLTGAGISAESGVPTFRGADGLYVRYYGRVMDPAEIATPEFFGRDPATSWSWYLMRARILAGALPNPGHVALARWIARDPDARTLVTTNVDRLHEAAGTPDPVHHLHGSILPGRCTRCKRDVDVDPGDYPEDLVAGDELPACPCGALARPAVVWFGEMPSASARAAAVEALVGADAVLEIGCGGAVDYGFVGYAIRSGVPVVEVNPKPHRRGSIALAGPAAEVLPALLG